MLAQVPYERRVNRATIALFNFKNGMVGSLNHTLLMHGQNFFTELDIYGDGFHILIKDPYQHPHVLFRRPHSNDYEKVSHDLMANATALMHFIWFGGFTHCLLKHCRSLA